MTPPASRTRDRVALERDLYRHLLDLGDQEAPAGFLERALSLVLDVTAAERGYLAVYGEGERRPVPRWWIAEGYSLRDIHGIHEAVSGTIIDLARSRSATVNVVSALDDPRFRDRPSVRAHEIRQVLCVPLGQGAGAGVLYLESARLENGFTAEDVGLAELFAHRLAPLAARLVRGAAPDRRPDVEKQVRRLGLDGRIAGTSRALGELLDQVELASRFSFPVLMLGPRGSGKTELARVIHAQGPRRGGPFVEVNCAAIPDTLVESELFGALPGAHSGATRRVEGKVAAAKGGTLFLDEVAELPARAQAALLQLLDPRQLYWPLGSSRPQQADVRVVAATNADLDQAMAERRFRADLYDRLNGYRIETPALSRRREDIAPLVAHFCGALARRYGLPPLPFSSAAIRRAEAAPWEGNVRELEKAVERALVTAASEGAPTVDVRHLFPGAAAGPPAPPQGYDEATRAFQRGLLVDTLEGADWNVAEAGRRLGLSRGHVHYLMRGFGIQRGRGGEESEEG